MTRTSTAARTKSRNRTNYQNGVAHKLDEMLSTIPKSLEAPHDGKYVTEEEYWAIYYEKSDCSYEWNNGILEAKPMPKLVQLFLYNWFFDILRRYLKVHPVAIQINLEVGFSMTVPDPDQPDAMKKTIRKPDIGIIRNDNPVLFGGEERSYKGICDLCIEGLSDSASSEVERDTVTKKAEYEFAGVKEYFILDADGQHTKFYRRTEENVYIEIDPDENGVIESEVLPGFQFRLSDLDDQPDLEEMALDEVYRGYILPKYQSAEARAEQESLRAEQEKQDKEREKRRADRYAAKLRELGIALDDDD
ncbi:Uma2 family endonuclease [Chloroflexi bacterium TSY]|nr:Uma2 family endonuclease [Chloroflexi bacterium TSY]